MDLWKNLLCFLFQCRYAIFLISYMWMSATQQQTYCRTYPRDSINYGIPDAAFPHWHGIQICISLTVLWWVATSALLRSSVRFFKMIAIISLFWKLIISPRHNWKLLIRVHELLLIKSRTGKFENQTLHETICCYSWMINQRTYYQMWYYVLYRNSSFQIMYLITTDLIIRTLEVALSEIGNGLETTRIHHSALSQKVKYLMQRYVF